jgi:carotenoid 1,2-hydratase
MTERGPRTLRRSATALSLARSSVSWDRDGLRVEIDEVAVPIPRRVRGVVTLKPRHTVPAAIWLDQDQRHRWQPIAPSAAVDVVLEKPGLRWSGEGYLDSNAGDEPLERCFKSWEWSRLSLADRTAVLYDVSSRHGTDMSLAACFDRSGEVTSFAPPPRVALPRSAWRIPRTTRSDPEAAPSLIKTLEDGPFYARSVISTGLQGETATGVHESLSLDRFSRRWVQSLLPFRMPRIPGGAA